MFDFLKRLFKKQDRELTFVLFDDEEPESSISYHFKPSRLWRLFYASLVAVALLALLLVMFTPLGALMYNRQDAELRQRAIRISQKVRALQDSLRARDSQLTEIQNVITSEKDTTFSIEKNYSESAPPKNKNKWELDTFSKVSTQGALSQNEIIFSKIFQGGAQFPANYPIEGTFTRGYSPADGHYGIDIATKKGTPFRAVADGAILSQEWTINYGFVVEVQHSDGIITVYKHASSLAKSIGDIVLKGDILGTVGNVGILSSGPHLHIEIWRNGVPQNPNTYLIKS